MREDTSLPLYRAPRRFVAPRPLDKEGLRGPTPGAARGPEWEQTTRGFYLPRGVDRTLPEQRIAEAAVTLPDDSCVTGWGSLLMHGAAFCDGQAPNGSPTQPVHLRVPPGTGASSYDGIVHVQGHAWDAVEINGVRCAVAVPALFDSMRLRRSVRDAVVDIDMTAGAGVVSVEQMAVFLQHRRSWRGIPGVRLVRQAVELANARSASPPETRVRMVWELDAQLPRPLVNHPILAPDGRLIGIPDLFDEEAGLAVEYDGQHHRSAAQHQLDVGREDRFRRAGIEVAHVVAGDLSRRQHLVRRLVEARRRARFAAPRNRQWLLGPNDLFRPKTS